MRKSSISNRNANILSNDRRSRGRSTDGHRSSLLQPGFALKHRRSSSTENRDSGIGALQKRPQHAMRRSRSQLNLAQPCVTPSRRETFSPASSRTTPSHDSLKYGTISRGVVGTTQKPKRDTRNFNDKGVLSTAIAQVNNYFARAGGNVVLSARQPPSLKTFLDATVFLLNEAGMSANITSNNYIEEIPFMMRLLNYPGSLATSWLKTAYAQHSLQHVIAMLSWLVELIESSDVPNPFGGSHVYDEDFRILPVKDYYDFFTVLHAQWNLFQPEEAIVEEFKEKLAQTFMPDFDERRKDALVAEIESLAEKCRDDENIMKQKNDLEETLSILQSDIAKVTTHLKNTHKFTLSLDSKIESLETQRGETEGKMVHIQCLTEKLKQQVASQEMSVEDLNELLQTCEHLKGRVRSAEKCIAELQEMAFECDKHIVQARAKFNKRMEIFNNLLVMESCSIPELSELQIRSIVLADSYKAEADEVDGALLALHKDSVATHFKTQEALCNIKREVDEVSQSVDSERQEITSLTERALILEGRIAKVQASIQNNEAKMREEEGQLQEEINKYLNKVDTATLEDRLAAMLAKQETWEIALEKLKQKSTQFFQESVAITKSFAVEVQNIQNQNADKIKKLIELKKTQLSKRH